MIDEENQPQSVQDAEVGSSKTSPELADIPAVETGSDTEAALGDGTPTVQLDSSPAVGDTAPTFEEEAVENLEVDYPAALAALEGEIAVLKAQIEERTNQCIRIAADFDNFRRRTQREREDLELQIKCSTINEILPVVDNFERARSHIKPQTDQETNIHKSYQSVYKQLVDCLKRVGVAPMRSEGKEFDPNLHEAVMRQATSEYSEGTVMEELQRGYMLGERVLRHALVKVAAPPEPEMESGETDQSGSES